MDEDEEIYMRCMINSRTETDHYWEITVKIGKCAYSFVIRWCEEIHEYAVEHYGDTLLLTGAEHTTLEQYIGNKYNIDTLLNVQFTTTLRINDNRYVFNIMWDPSQKALCGLPANTDGNKLIVENSTYKTLWTELYHLHNVVWMKDVYMGADVTLNQMTLIFVLQWDVDRNRYVALPAEADEMVLSEADYLEVQSQLSNEHDIEHIQLVTCSAYRQTVQGVLDLVSDVPESLRNFKSPYTYKII